MKINYNKSEDLLSDESFVAWVNTQDMNASEKWNEWIDKNPEKKDIVMEAVRILNLLEIKEPGVDKEKIDAAESRLMNFINNKVKAARIVKMRKKILYWSAAAAVFLTMALGIFFVSRAPKELKFVTNYGEVKKDKLPDGTQVVLNANTQLTFNKKWEAGKDREVWIKGEVFFHVKKTLQHSRFIVHTDAFDIEVTGTSFNVINEDNISSVVLQEGSVNIYRNGKKEIVMKPGDVVEYDNHIMKEKKTDNQDYMAWIDSKIVFDNTSISELANIIEEHYGLKVRIEGNDISEKTITGIMPNNNLDILLQSLNATHEFKVLQTKDSIIITGFK